MKTIRPKTHDMGCIFFCITCDFRTSGVILREKDPLKRFCPICSEVLIWCQDCHQYLSSKILDGKIVCGKCESDIPEPHFNINK